jgi:hypothetical protein
VSDEVIVLPSYRRYFVVASGWPFTQRNDSTYGRHVTPPDPEPLPVDAAAPFIMKS